MEVESVRHCILFASLTPAAQAAHPYKRALGDLLGKREAMQRERASLLALAERTPEQDLRVDLLESLNFLAKIS